jgi:riboflavin synthase
MFTGIIQEVGRVLERGASRLRVSARLTGLKAGASVAVNGACLTVIPPLSPRRLAFDVSGETWKRTNLGELSAGMPVNLEAALRAGEPLGGHLVSGHVDARAEILELERARGGFVRLRVALPKALKGLVALKGSVAVDGISLTVTAVGRGWFETVLVPHTLRRTTIGRRRPGQYVNLEADLLARYVRQALGKS